MQNKRIILYVSLFVLPLVSIAGTFPRGCEVTGYSFADKQLLLNEDGKQTLYFMQNISSDPVDVERFETRDVFMSPQLKTRLQPDRWAAFASDIKNTHFKCYSNINGQKTLTPCGEILNVCQYPRVKFALSNMGNYWASSDKSLQQVIRDCTKKGILLRW